MASFNVAPFHLYDIEHKGAVQRHASTIWVNTMGQYNVMPQLYE